jgi:hypothetical protein
MLTTLSFTGASGDTRTRAEGLLAQVHIGCALPQPLSECESYLDSVRLFDAHTRRFRDVATCTEMRARGRALVTRGLTAPDQDQRRV